MRGSTPIHLHRGRPEDQPRPPGRISIDDLASQGWPAELQPTCYVYGPTGFGKNPAIDIFHYRDFRHS